jgi:hypothetical protein
MIAAKLGKDHPRRTVLNLAPQSLSQDVACVADRSRHRYGPAGMGVTPVASQLAARAIANSSPGAHQIDRESDGTEPRPCEVRIKADASVLKLDTAVRATAVMAGPMEGLGLLDAPSSPRTAWGCHFGQISRLDDPQVPPADALTQTVRARVDPRWHIPLSVPSSGRATAIALLHRSRAIRFGDLTAKDVCVA